MKIQQLKKTPKRRSPSTSLEIQERLPKVNKKISKKH